MSDQPLKFRPAGQEDLDDVRSCIGGYFELFELAGIEPDDNEDTPQHCDHLVRWWHSQNEKTRPESTDIENCIGAALGDYIRHVLRVEWMLVSDGEDEAIVLANPADPDEFMISPFDAISEYLPDNPDGFVAEMVAGLLDEEAMQDLFRPEGESPLPLFGE